VFEDQRIVALASRLILHCVQQDFGAVIRAGWNGHVEDIKTLSSVSKLSAGAGTQRGWDFRQQLIVVRAIALEHADVTLTPWNINAPVAGIEENIIGVLCARQRGDHAA